MKTQKQIALDAAKALREIGWCQHQFKTTNDNAEINGLCAVGAIRHAVGLYDYDQTRFDRLAHAQAAEAASVVIHKIDALIPALLPEWYGGMDGLGGSPLVNYNDSQKRTREEVIELFERAAELLPDVEAWHPQPGEG